MLSKKELCSLYSVFVGHLSPTVTEDDLRDLFSGCGVVEDVFICDSTSGSQFLFGFVRYRDIESVYKAVKTLHKWSLKGNKLVVDIAKDTGDRIKKGGDVAINVNKLLSTPNPGAPLVKDRPATVATSNIIQDVMHLGRLKECYASVSMEAKHCTGAFAGQKTVNVTDIDDFMKDIEQSDGGKSARFGGKIQKDTSPETVYQALLNSDDLNPAFGMNRANQFLSAMKVVMGNMASFLKDHELMPTEAGAISSLCAEVEKEEEEKSNEENSHSSQEETKVNRDSGFESELEAREREQESSDSRQGYNLVSSSVPKSVSSESSRHTSKQSENDALNSYSSKCSSFEPEVMEFHRKLEEDTEELNDRDSGQEEEEAEIVLEEHEELVDYVFMPSHEDSKDVEEIIDSVSLGRKNVDDDILKGKKPESSSQGKAMLENDTPLDRSGSESGEDQRLCSQSSVLSHSVSSLSHSVSSEIARPKSNYYSPISPVSPDVSVISSALHSKPSPSISSLVSNLSATIGASLHLKSATKTEVSHTNVSPTIVTTEMEASRSDVSPTIVSSNPERTPSPTISSSASHSSSPVISALNSPVETPVECAHITHTSIKHSSFHKSISDSEVSRFHNPKQFHRTNSTTSDQNVQPAISPKYEESKKLNLDELFDLCKRQKQGVVNGQKQGVATERVSLQQIFSLCNGQKQEVSKEACLLTREDSLKKHAPTGVQQGEFQKYLEIAKLGRGRGLGFQKKTVG